MNQPTFLSRGARLLFCCLLFLVMILPATGCDKKEVEAEFNADKTQWYVSTSGDDDNPCHTLAHPCRNIATAISRAVEKDTIHVANGDYYEVLQINKALTLTGESMTGTIIDSQLEGTVITVDGSSYPNGVSLTIENLTLTGGVALDGNGGGLAIRHGGYVQLTNLAVTGNTANSKGGGMYINPAQWVIMNGVSVSGNQTGTTGMGGGIYFSGGEDYSSAIKEFKLEIRNSTISENTARDGAGIVNGATLIIFKSTVESNTAQGRGGGILNGYQAEVVSSNILNNKADSGGGILSTEILSISETTIDGNEASTGGGIMLEYSGAGIISSTISNNTAAERGGGVCAYGVQVSMSAINSTFSGNHAGQGGGIYLWRGTFDGKNLTFAYNTGFGIFALDAAPSLTNILMAYNSDANCEFNVPPSKVEAGISSDDSCTQFTEADPALQDLADNGGLTKTHALLPGSPARDAGVEVAGLYTDQRQSPRPLDSDGDGTAAYDVGAFEAEYVELPIMTLQPPADITPTLPLMGVIFTPAQNPSCREGPDPLYRLMAVAEKGKQYPVLGRAASDNWLLIQMSEAMECWVISGSGSAGDLSGVPVIIFPIATFTPSPMPVVCSSYTSQDVCAMHTECRWIPAGHDPSGLPIPAKCVNR